MYSTSVKYILLFTVINCVSADYGGGGDDVSRPIPPAPVNRAPVSRPPFINYPSNDAYPPHSPSQPCLENPPIFPASMGDGYGDGSFREYTLYPRIACF